jgi:hypothetical protein
VVVLAVVVGLKLPILLELVVYQVKVTLVAMALMMVDMVIMAVVAGLVP